MSVSLGELVRCIGGRLEGNPGIEIDGIAGLDDARENQLTFLSNPKLKQTAKVTKAGALILTSQMHEIVKDYFSGACIISENPYVYFARVAQFFFELSNPPPVAGISSKSDIHHHAKLAPTATVGPFVTICSGAVIGERVVLDAGCYVGANALIDDDTHFYANVSFHSNCVIGKRSIIHSGAVIGADGFGFANENGRCIKITQTGRVVIGNDVEVGANTCIDRGALGDTIIKDGVKLDNLIQIAHNCQVGEHTIMAGCVGIAGSAHIGKHCAFGGASMIHGHLTIADYVQISASTMVPRSINEPGTYTGIYPIAKNTEWEKSAVLVRNLSKMRDKIRVLEKKVQSLTNQSSEN